MATDYNKLKVTELKDILKDRGIPQTGLSRKQQIVEALEKHDAEQGAEGPAQEEQIAAKDEEEPSTVEGQVGAEENVKTEDEKEVQPIVQEEKSEPKRESDEEQSVKEEIAHPVSEESDSKKEESAPLPVASDSKPIILENNDPLSKEPSTLNTPQRSSPAAESVSSDTRKRKRRSPTPPLSQESVNKKLKAAAVEEDLIVKLPEDQAAKIDGEDLAVKDAPVAVDRTAESGADNGTVLSSASNDDDIPINKTTERRNEETNLGEDKMDIDTPTAGPAMHPATRALYIRDLVRPLNANQLRAHLLDLATPPNSSPDESLIEAFHVDTIRTHAFVLFTSSAAAVRTRSALHSRVWPNEPTRKALWVDFVPDDKVTQWIDMERQAEEGKGRAGVRRWEVVYDEGKDGVVARFEEANTMPTGPARHESTSSATGQGMGMPNAPLGPRGSRRPSNPQTSSETTKQPPSNPAPVSASFDVLDERFRHTTTKPKLYYLPKNSSIVSSRLDALAAITSRDWNSDKEGSFTSTGDVRRYTFEDNDRVVDGGADIGNFGRPRGMELAPRSGRGGRGGRGGRW